MDTVWNSGIAWNLLLQHLGPGWKTPMEVLSFLGTETFFLLLLPALYWCVDAGLGLRVGVMLLLNASVNDGLKMLFHGPRPYWCSADITAYAGETSFGPPSGHAQIATGVWGMLAAGFRRAWGWAVAVVIILSIGVSRLYLGVHFPHDVAAAWLIGALLLWIVLKAWDPVAARVAAWSPNRRLLAAFLSSMAMVLFSLLPFAWLKVASWQPPPDWAGHAANAVSMKTALTTAGTLFGFLAGRVWLDRRGGFAIDGPPGRRLLRFILGLVGLLVLYLGLKGLFALIVPDADAALPYVLRYVRYVLVGGWISAGAPWMFLRLKPAGPAV